MCLLDLIYPVVVTPVIREVRLWWDLTNAFSSIPHVLVEVTLEKHHVPLKVKDFFLD